MHTLLMEALGAFLLVLVIGLTNNAFAIGIILAALIYVGRSISGAHYNPAVSFAFYLKKKLSATEFFMFSLSQIIGGFFGIIAIYFFSSMVFYLEPPADSTLYQQVGAEVLFSFLFVFVMVAFSLTPVLRKNHLYGFAVGLTFSGIILIGGHISGGMFNPALSISSSLFDLTLGGESYTDMLLYVLGPLTGGALAAAVHTYFEIK